MSAAACDTNTWSEARHLSQTNNNVCNTWGVKKKTLRYSFTNPKDGLVSLVLIYHVGLKLCNCGPRCRSRLRINLLLKLIYSVHASVHLPALCCVKKRGFERGTNWDEGKLLICSRGGSCYALSLFTGLQRSRFESQSCDGFTPSRRDQPVLISGWSTVSALRREAAGKLFVIYCANQLNWKLDNYTLRHT